MQYFQPDLITIYGGSRLTTFLANPDHYFTTRYSETVEYINGLNNVNVIVVNRYGNSVILDPTAPTNGSYNNIFVIRRKLVVDSRSVPSFLESLGRFEENGDDTCEIIGALKEQAKSYLEDFYKGGAHNYKNFVAHIDTLITAEDLHRAGGVAYIAEADIIISTTGKEVVHPYSPKARRLSRLFNVTNEHKDTSLFYKIEIVDNNGRCGRRYVRLANGVYNIDPIQDPLRKDGVYVTKNLESAGKFSLNDIKETYYTMEDGEKELLLFRSYEEARVDGDLSTQRKKELGDLEYETTKMKAEANKEAIKDKFAPDMLKKIIDIIKPMSVILASIFGGVKLIYTLGKAAGSKK